MVNGYCRLTDEPGLNRLLTNWSLLFSGFHHAIADFNRPRASYSFVLHRSFVDDFGGMFQDASPTGAFAFGQIDHRGQQRLDR
jgi:hypothetical protein